MNWNNIRPLNGSINEGFEELICQLARKEQISNQKRFVRKGKPDAGVECFWVLEDGKEVAWQAKFFTQSFTTSQWAQIDESVKNALEKHPSLTKLIIAVPIDPPDARTQGTKSMLEKWDERVEKWQEWASEKSMTVQFLPWWSSDIITLLQKPENEGMVYFWFNKEEYTTAWFLSQNDHAIEDLGKRYTPKLNVELDISKIFDGLSRNNNFQKRFRDLVDNLLIEGKKILTSKYDAVKKDCESLNTLLQQIHTLIKATQLNGIDKIPIDQFIETLDPIYKSTNNIQGYYASEESKISDGDNYYKKYGSEIRQIRKFLGEVYDFENYLENTEAELSNLPSLILTGGAGMGKSHLFADIVSQRNKEKQLSLLLLGQQMVTEEDPWVQVLKKLHLSCSVDNFLGALNAKAESSGHRLIIFVDALNEGKGRYFWEDNIKSFISRIQKYEWLGLALSIRTSYEDLIAPKEKIDRNLALRYTHYGFHNVEYEASKIFFDNYGIELPSIPMLHPEFQQPLFLLLFCEGLSKAGLTRIPEGFQGITTILKFYLDTVNKNLSLPKRLEYPTNINVVEKVINALIDIQLSREVNYIPYEEAFVEADKILSHYSNKRGLLDELISEGVFSKNLFWKGDGQYEEGIYFSYERFEDHLKVKFLLQEVDDIDSALDKDGLLFKYIEDGEECLKNKGLLEALSIQLPEIHGKELHDFLGHLEDWVQYHMAEVFLDGLLWRKTETITPNLVDHINILSRRSHDQNEKVLETLMAVSTIPNHHFNADFLHRHLIQFSMPDRDQWWIPFLKNQLSHYGSVTRLVEWGWNMKDKSHISDESIFLACTMLSWYLASSDRKLRDHSTKALVCLLSHRLHLVESLLKKFAKVNDPSIYERLFAVAYGSSLRANNTSALPELSKYIYNVIFNKSGEIYPHALLRDYARSTIEYALYLGSELDVDVTKIRPPYQSNFPQTFPSDEEIDKYDLDYKSEGFKDYMWGQNMILSSMGTEGGKRSYGDFGRYVFQSALHDWELNAHLLSNLAVKWIFEKYGYDVEKHGRFDRQIGSGRARNSVPNERIGKKYQWISLYEMMARVSDNFPKYDGYGRYKKEVLYNGPWEPYERDIDPTLLISRKSDFDEDHQHSTYWWDMTHTLSDDVPHDVWLASSDDIPKADCIIDVTDDQGDEWLALQGYPEWAGEKLLGEEKWDIPHKRMWWQIRSYIVKNEDYDEVLSMLKSKRYFGSWMPQSPDRYEIFNREYYWSPAYRDFQVPYYGGELWREVHHDEDGFIGEVSITAESYFWEEQFDASKEETINILKPNKIIYDGLKLKYAEKEGQFLDEDGNLICFDPSVYNPSRMYLLIKKKPLLEFLQKKGLRIFWTVIGEKQIVGGYMSGREFNASHWLEINGLYEVAGDKIVGEQEFEKKS